jgi:hypothetical protein
MKYLIVILLVSLSSLFGQEAIVNPVQSQSPKKAVGFQKGSILFSASLGLLAASGSLIDTDKAYNSNLSTQAQLGLVDSKVQPFVTPFSYRASNSKSMSIEYGLTDKFAIGVAALQFNLNATGQNRYPTYVNTGTAANPTFVRSRDQTVYSIPGNYLMYNGTNVMLLASYHFIPKFFIDPYLHIKAGGGFFNTSSHRNLYDDDKYFLKTGDFLGYSKIVGAGAGVNFFVLNEVGIKLEVEHYRQFLISPNFSTQTLNTTHLQLGFVFDLNQLR